MEEKIVHTWLKTNTMTLNAEGEVDILLAKQLRDALEDDVAHKLLKELRDNDLIKFRSYRGDKHLQMEATIKVIHPEAEPS